MTRARAKERRNSRATSNIVKNLAIKMTTVEKKNQRRNKLNIGRMMPAEPMWTFWSKILKGHKNGH